jgi:hypothetical protein
MVKLIVKNNSYMFTRQNRLSIENGIGLISVLLLLSIFFGSCKTRKGQQRCITNYTKNIRLSDDYKEIIKAAQDTVSNWENMNIRYAIALKRSVWKIDNIVLFNDNKTRAILFLLKIDKDSDAVLDFAKMLAAEKKEGIWYFYSVGMPTMGFNREGRLRPHTYEELSEGIMRKIIKGGLLKKMKCQINEDYINGWFYKLDKYHEDFLKDTIQ